MADTVRQVAQRLSLRVPQKESLEILEKISKAVGFNTKEDAAAKLTRAKALEFRAFQEFERGFPSFTFALATGVGKTRLMGACVSYLFLEHGIKDFLILAPNLTIYNKLIEDFSNASNPKYVFNGIGEFVHSPPKIITGDNYANVNTQRKVYTKGIQGTLFGEEVAINIFNISKINAETKGGASPKIKRLSEYLGESYFEYLRNIDKLVILMDEAHQYRAERGMTVINELNPILGLEFTATAKAKQGNDFVPFKNIVFEYSLGQAMQDGFVKEPAVATRKNVSQEKLKKMEDDELDHLKLEDAIRVHENTKTHLLRYARDNGLHAVKPFILVIAKDTDHAGEIAQFIKSEQFFGSRYADKVITVHSNQRGEEKEENIQSLLNVEQYENPVEIVIHVNKLKEGWDVKNLYTIVPLRAFSTEILTEQTLGRGLRLPYGARTGDADVDQLTVIAHEHFDEIIKAAQKENSIVLKQTIIDIDDPAFSGEQVVVPVKGRVEEALDKEAAAVEKIKNEDERKQATIAVQVKRDVLEKLRADAAQTLTLDPAKVDAKETVKQIEEIVQGTFPFAGADADAAKEQIKQITKSIVKDFLPELVKTSISIPWIMVQPKNGAVQAGFKDFSLDTKHLPKFHPIHDEIQIRTLREQNDSYLGVINTMGVKDTNENRIVAKLIDHEEVDYEVHGELLYKLAGEMIVYLRTYLKDDKDISNVVETQRAQIAEQIWQQMKDKFYCQTTEYEEPVVKPFTKIEPHNLSMLRDAEPKDIKSTIDSTAELKKTLVTGFKRSCHSAYKFDVMPEFNFAKILEASGEKNVEKWLRPAPRQFHLHWNIHGNTYEPDFVVETKDGIWITEIKAENEMASEEVQEKKRAALQYCKYATEYNRKNGGKKWGYLLIPSKEVALNKDFAYFKNTFEATE